MLRAIKGAAWICLMGIALLIGCSQQSMEPVNEEASFTFTFKYDAVPESDILGMIPGSAVDEAERSIGKGLHLQGIDAVRVMVIDMSAYDTWANLTEKQEWIDYTITRDNWTGNLSNWGEWEKLIGGHFNIVSNQLLTIEGDYATGTVTGIIGLNRIIIAVIESNRIIHWGEGVVTGEAGETVEATIEWYY